MTVSVAQKSFFCIEYYNYLLNQNYIFRGWPSGTDVRFICSASAAQCSLAWIDLGAREQVCEQDQRREALLVKKVVGLAESSRGRQEGFHGMN